MAIPQPVLSRSYMRLAEEQAVQRGISTGQLMENAGKALADVLAKRYKPGAVYILCGHGNNGGDGYAAAYHLKQAGYSVTCCAVFPETPLKGDTAAMAKRWQQMGGTLKRFDEKDVGKASVVVDAVFGTGLNQPLPEVLLAIFQTVLESNVPVVAADLASGIDADTGAMLGGALPAAVTVAFGTIKPAHLLLPGKAFMGEIVNVDIGIPWELLYTSAPFWRNQPALWQEGLAWPSAWQHKYDRGHALILAGMELLGATRLMTESAARSGVGLVTVGAQPQQVTMLATALPAPVLLRSAEGIPAILEWIQQYQVSAVAFGPGATTAYRSKQVLEALLPAGIPLVLDADALGTMANNAEEYWGKASAPFIITPHSGEFETLFPGLEGGKIEKTLEAARISGAIVVHKGSDTVIASPDGRLALNGNAPPFLATAGSGDVLTGLITGLLAQGMSAWEAACAGVWLHAEAGNTVGLGLIASDLPNTFPGLLKGLKEPSPSSA
jgi:ADP-dependent NAD(P)H-hydrate dehydratase / NAD(P)H-hydrate epimerase